MKRKRFNGRTDHRNPEGVRGRGKKQEICRKHGISEHTLYRWRSKYGGMQVSEARKLKGLEAENRKLKQLLADAHLDNAALKELLSKNW